MIPGARRTGLALALVTIGVAGCSTKPLKISGKILKNGAPMVVSADTYVTLSFVPDGKQAGDKDAQSYSATFDQKTGSYTVELPPGRYRTMLVIALPPKQEGQLNAPSRPVKSDTVYDLTKDQELNVDAPGK